MSLLSELLLDSELRLLALDIDFRLGLADRLLDEDDEEDEEEDRLAVEDSSLSEMILLRRRPLELALPDGSI